MVNVYYDFNVNAIAGTGGTITPSGGLTPPGTSYTFTITPNTGYKIADVTDNGVSKGSISIYYLPNTQENHQIQASFAPDTTPSPPPITNQPPAPTDNTPSPYTQPSNSPTASPTMGSTSSPTVSSSSTYTNNPSETPNPGAVPEIIPMAILVILFSAGALAIIIKRRKTQALCMPS